MKQKSWQKNKPITRLRGTFSITDVSNTLQISQVLKKLSMQWWLRVLS